MLKRLFSIIVALLLCVSCFPDLTPEAEATSYDKPNTHVNTGDQRYDIVQVALTQRGYYEGAGNNNDTKYGEKLGVNFLGWCGSFVSWCAIEAGIPDSILKKTGVPSPSAFGLEQKPTSYIPKSGDLFFAKDYSHVGLVWYVDGDYFYTIEGNTWTSDNRHGVYAMRKLISSHYFASPNYRGGGEHKYVIGTEEQHPHKEYYKCNSCTDMYYTGKTTTVSGCKECLQATCSHSYSAWSKVNDNNHGRVCKKCDKVDSKAHSWDAGLVTKEATCNSTGTKTQKCTACSAEKTVTVPKTGVHIYSEWIKSNDSQHSRECFSCGIKQTGTHNVSKEWVFNEKQHWYACDDCLEQFQLADHEFGNTCDIPCKICGYVKTGGHLYDEIWKCDDLGHWQACTNCESKTEPENHIFSAECDEQCDTCGFTRETTHSFGESYVTDMENHWYECSQCGLRKEVKPHQPDDTSREGVMQHCTVCGLQLIYDKEHTHGYDSLFRDARAHWGSCSCGMEMPTESHSWSIQTGVCSVCGMASTDQSTNEYSDLMPWILGGAGILLFIAVMIVIAFVIRKKE